MVSIKNRALHIRVNYRGVHPIVWASGGFVCNKPVPSYGTCQSQIPAPTQLDSKIVPHLHFDIKTIASVYLLNINSKINSRSVSPTINTQDKNTNQTRDNITIIETLAIKFI